MNLAQTYDVALLDLDGVVYLGKEPVPHAVQSIGIAQGLGMRMGYVTNNASRTPDVVAAHLTSFGLAVSADDVVTSAQAAARVLAQELPPDAPVFVVGAEGLRAAVREAGFSLSDPEHAQAVVQGFSPDVTWQDLADACAVLARGVLWVASNMDLTFPLPHQVAPGNGAYVQMLMSISGRAPIVAGKPQVPLMQESIDRLGASKPLVVGDRLDTDIEGANNVGIDSLLVLTGVTGRDELMTAPAHQRPTWVGPDLRALVGGPLWSLEEYLAGSVGL